MAKVCPDCRKDYDGRSVCKCKVYCALYARVSTEEQDFQRQLSELQARASLQGLTVRTVFSEKVSGTARKRPGREALLEAARRGEFTVLLCTELSRLGRGMLDLLQTLEELAQAGVSVRCLHGPSFDFTRPAGKLIAAVLSAVAEMEREAISERTKSGMAEAKRRGKTFGGDRRSGWKKK